MTWEAAEWNRRAREAKNDRLAFDRLAGEQQAFIRRQAYRTVGHFISSSDEEWSTALLGFYEAVQNYSAEKGNFQTFAGMVIRRRLIDEIRRTRKERMEICVPNETLDGDPDEENMTSLDMEIGRKAAERSCDSRPEGNPLREEIEAFRQDLAGFGISFSDLPDSSPSSAKTRENCAAAVRTILAHGDLRRTVLQTGKLPMKELEDLCGLPRKKLERHRKYIVAVILILEGDYPMIAEYVKPALAGRTTAAVLPGTAPEAAFCVMAMVMLLR